jgi:tRNA(Arg) A34 adenosine deaminase TadA
MNAALAKNVVELSRNLIELTPHRSKHFSFVVRRNTIVSIGWNQPFKTHPQAQRFGYRFNCIHSELHAILKFSKAVRELSHYMLVNVRLDKQGDVRMSKPCVTCQKLLGVFTFNEVWYSTNEGQFAAL